LTRAAVRPEQISERIGHHFADPSLLAEALTHGSSETGRRDYQRLEFLGDRILGLVIAEHLYRAFPGHEEGELTARHSALVRREACASAADRIGLADLVIVGAGERAKGMNLNRGVLGDVMESLIAAVYLDGGFDAARRFVLNAWAGLLSQPQGVVKDAKTFLQEWALGRGLPIPVYGVLSREGPEHEPVFVVSVEVKDRAPAQGVAKSKRAAEMEAAAAFLRREGLRS
jgi:ribonuclease-3